MKSSTNGSAAINHHYGSDSDDDAEAFPEENVEQIKKIIVDIFWINRGGETRIVEETLRIRRVFEAHSDQSEEVLLEPLRRLQLLAVSFDTLKETMIGKSVKGLTKHKSKKIREHAWYLVTKWRRAVDQWLIASEALATTKTMEVVECSLTSVVDEQEKFKTKMEASKRKLKDGYQRAENAKKQRRVQVMELKDLPKQWHNNQKRQGRNKKR